MLQTRSICVNYLKDALFPLFCLDCGEEGKIICESCFGKINAEGISHCPVCHNPSNNGWACANCQSRIDRHIAIIKYIEAGLSGRLFHAFKYQYIEDALERILDLISDFIKKNARLFNKIDVVVSIPLHPRRYAERGFNQAELIADELSLLLGVPKLPCLSRVIRTAQQAKLNKEERINNVKHAFKFIGRSSIVNKKVLLVDDIYTTGCTMQECASVLKKAGAKQIIGFTVARG